MENTQVGPFLILSRLGNTRRQKVYKARQIEQGREVALKFISIPKNIPREKVLDKVDREVQFLQKLKHPNLVRVLGAGVEDDQIFLAQELIEGESLASVMARRGKLAPDLAVDYASQICDLLQYIHSHELLHAKLTPEKVLIDKSGKVRVTDLRINRSKRKRWDAVSSRRVLDLAAYMAPEQPTDGVSVKSDLYSLGVITYEMLTGKLPYAPDTMGRMTNRKKNEPVPSAAKVVMNCPVWLDQIVTQMLQPEPRRRPHTAKAVAMAFDEIKKIDRSKKAAISQVSGKFNALTAGQDKSEARKLLGKKKKKKKAPQVPIYETVPFLIGCLALIVAIGIFALWPTSTQKLFDRGVELVESDNPKDWPNGRTVLRKVIDRKSSDFSSRAEDFILFSKRRSLVNQAEIGKKSAIQSKPVQKFIDAYEQEMNEEYKVAIQMYRQILSDIEGDEKKIYMKMEVSERLTSLENYVKLPFERDKLMQLLGAIRETRGEEELRKARNILIAIQDRFGKNQQYLEVVREANKLRTELEDYLDELDANRESDQDSDAETSSEDQDASNASDESDEESDTDTDSE